ncbi:DNA topoisomerase 3 [Endozoicomonas sp. SM1973]|uniref:DNA topoisomerase n=1 Tax=Spartinivicinus marinus TaxID=2994442 RepID=A0A853I324_9GAMM|nr:DNA topoisomerase 3 [Spartinivicinus marinus]MCX4030150.1 DNA topoisomerase 3 [Spartinivicinus marinus]NYZ67793.1 DNA topoisomerase 3 [Spartinivicinus marinus]
MRLFIAEKPELAEAIVAGLGVKASRRDGYYDCGDDIVTWCYGHLLELCDPEDYDPRYKKWNKLDLPIFPIPWKYKVKKGAEKQINVIKTLLDNATVVVNSADCDSQGQLLVDEILVHFKNEKPVQRILINDNNTKAVKKALNNLRDNREFFGLYQSALAQSVADQLYGYNLTRCYTLAGQEKGLSQVLSIGRVQTPLLGLVVRRDRLHEGHESSVYYTLTGSFTFNQQLVNATYNPSAEAPVDDKKRVIGKAFITAVAEQCKGKPAIIAAVEVQEKEESAPLPYNLLRLQADASRKFSITSDKTLSITQALREKYKVITYNRSDCEYLPEDQHDDAPAVLNAIYQTGSVLKGAAQKADPTIKSRAFNSANVSAHHGIIPTENSANFDQMSKQEQQIYLLIARAYIAQFFPKQLCRLTKLTIDCEGHQFQTNSRIVLKPGWSILYKNDKDNDELDHSEANTKQDFSEFQSKTDGVCTNAQVDEKKTKPPALYTESSLLKDLARVAKYIEDPQIKKLLIEKDQDKKGEHGGIGTPATRSSIIKGLFERGFIENKGKKIISTKLGRQLHDVLPKMAVVPDMTALWHQQQKQIENNELTLNEFLQGVCEYIETEVQRINTDGLAIEAKPGHKCPECEKGILRQRKGFWGCSRYPECKGTYSEYAGKPVIAQPACPNCTEGKLKRIPFKKNHFWGCNRHPECKTNFPDKAGKPDFNNAGSSKPEKTNYACEKCSKPLMKWPSKKKKNTYWYGCSGFKDGCKQKYVDDDGKPDYDKAKEK